MRSCRLLFKKERCTVRQDKRLKAKVTAADYCKLPTADVHNDAKLKYGGLRNSP